MGITISSKNHSIDMGTGGFFRIRNKIAELVGEPFASHYAELMHPPLFGTERENFFINHDKETERLIKEKKVSIKIVDFLYQSDIEGRIRYGACKQILKIIGDYDDNICYGYCGRPDCAMFSDFKKILQDCVDNKCCMRWY